MKKEKYIYERQTKKGSKYFQIQIAYTDAFGMKKTYYENVQFSDYNNNRSLALKASVIIRDKALVKIHSNKMVGSSPTVQQIYEKVFDLIPVSQKTQIVFNGMYRKGIYKYKDIEITKVTISMVQKSVNEFSLSHSDAQIKLFINSWSKIFSVANMLGYDISNKSKLIIVPKSEKVIKKREVVASNDTVEQMLSILDNYHSHKKAVQHRARIAWFLIQIMRYTGMRPAEVLALNADDISDTSISVTKSIASTRDLMIAITHPKTHQSIREVPICEELKPILVQLLHEQHTSPLLTEFDGSLIDEAHISAFIWYIKKKYNIKFNLYMLRHNMATNLIQNNTNPRAVQDILGHAEFTMSMGYARSTESERQKAIENIAKKQKKE